MLLKHCQNAVNRQYVERWHSDKQLLYLITVA